MLIRCRFDFNLTDIGFVLTEMSLKLLLSMLVTMSSMCRKTYKIGGVVQPSETSKMRLFVKLVNAKKLNLRCLTGF